MRWVRARPASYAPTVERSVVEAEIRAAFGGVRLGRGVSLSVAELIDEWADPALVESLIGREPDEDWADITAAELERADCIAHLDAEGLRYYLPALMLWLLDHYDEAQSGYLKGDMAVIGTISTLDQRDRHPFGFLELLTPHQRRAVARYVRALPELVELGHEDGARMARAWRDVWSREVVEESATLPN